MGRGLTAASRVNFCQPGVNLCQRLVAGGEGVLVGWSFAAAAGRGAAGTPPALWGVEHEGRPFAIRMFC